MSAETKYFKLGLFVLIAVAVAAGTIVALGAGRAFRPKIMAETYVDESVQGLDVGAPVKFRGVHVGQLEKIEFVAVRYEPKDPRIVLTIAFWPEMLHGYGGADPLGRMKELVESGMRVRMASSGLTGGIYLELDNFKPEENPVAPLSWTPANAYLPSIASTNTRLMSRVENVLEHVEKMRFDVIGDKIIVLVESLDKTVKSIQPALDEIRKFAGEATTLAADTRKVLTEDVGKELKLVIVQIRETLDKDLGPALKGVRTTTDRLPETFVKIDATLDKLGGTLRRMDRTMAEDNGSLDEALDNLRVMSGDLRELMAQVKRYPSQALFGEAPPKKAVNK